MRNAVGIQVQRAIVHIIDHPSQTVTESELELDLGANQKLRDYFGDQVRNALGDDKTSSARLAPEATDRRTIDACYKILRDETRLVASSSALARLLMQAMGTSASIKKGDLAVCVYTAQNYAGTSFLALIKLDPGDAFVQKVEKPGGKNLVTFEVRTNVLPTANERLQKADSFLRQRCSTNSTCSCSIAKCRASRRSSPRRS